MQNAPYSNQYINHKMKQGKQIAKRFREVLLNGDWVVGTNYKEQLTNLTWEQVTTKVSSLNTIAALTFHINYYIAGILNVLEGGPLEIKDKYSFDISPIKTQKDWEELLSNILNNAEMFANIVERMTNKELEEVFVNKK